MDSDFQPFGPAHLAIMAAIPAAAAGLGRWLRRKPGAARPLRLALAGALALTDLAWWGFRYYNEGVHASRNLPLQLSDFSFWVAIVALFTCSRWAYDFAYYVGLPSAAMAVITPDLWAPWSSFSSISFFVAHGGIIVAVLMLLWGGLMKPRPPGLWRTWAPLLAWVALAGAVDAAFGANYMYLREKPQSVSILTWFGPWPVYIAATAALTLALFRLLSLPFRPSGRKCG